MDLCRFFFRALSLPFYTSHLENWILALSLLQVPSENPGFPTIIESHGVSSLSSWLDSLGTVQEPPTRTTCLSKVLAVHLQFVPQYTPHLYRCASLLLNLEEREKPQHASNLNCSTPPICTEVHLRLPLVPAMLLRSTSGWGFRKAPESQFSKVFLEALECQGSSQLLDSPRADLSGLGFLLLSSHSIKAQIFQVSPSNMPDSIQHNNS